MSGVLLVPVLFTFLWMTVFGNTALWQEANGVAPLVAIVRDNLPVALFAALEALPLATLASAVAALLVVTFFVTSADSGALVMDMITSGAATDSPVWQRIFWAISAGAIAGVLLISGGLNALQTAAIVSALPFAMVMIVICYGVLRALQQEGTPQVGTSLMDGGAPGASWQQRLSALLESNTKEDIEGFLQEVALPALQDVAAQFRQSGHAADLTSIPGRVDLIVHAEATPFRYSVRVKGFLEPTFALAEPPLRESRERAYRALAESSHGQPTLDVTGFTREQLINDFLARYARSRAQTRSERTA